MPGASTSDGGIATFSVSGESMALWAGLWKAQFLDYCERCGKSGREKSTHTSLSMRRRLSGWYPCAQ